MENVRDEKPSYKFWTGIFFTLLYGTATVLLSYLSAWICYQAVKKVNETIIVFILLPIPQDVLMVHPLFYPLGLTAAVLGSIIIFQLYRKAQSYFRVAKNRAYKAFEIVMLVLSCVLSLGAAISAYLNVIFPQGALKHELFFAGVCTNIVPVMMISQYIIDYRHSRRSMVKNGEFD